MSAFPARFHAAGPEPEHPRLQQQPLTAAEARARWEVRAAQWRAVELAERVFGHVEDASLSGARTRGAIRGLLRLDVPFEDLSVHREREALFMAAAAADPVLARVPLVYVFGPRPG